MTADEPVVHAVQMAPHEALWVRGDQGICNLQYVRSFAVSPVSNGAWMAWAHASMRDAKAIPLVKCSTEEQAKVVLDQLHGLTGALDVRPTAEGVPS